MPELPEVEIVKRSLLKTVNKAKIIDIKINNKNLRYKIPKLFRTKLINKRILKISRKAKYIVFHFKEFILLSHLGMTGKFLIKKIKNNQMYKTSFYYDLNILHKHNHIYFILNNGIVLIYNDVRRFGFFKLYESKTISNIPFLNKLGAEPLSKIFNFIYFKKFIHNKNCNIKTLLMNQEFVSGLGNIYVNEVLFITKINPLKLCKELKKYEIRNLIVNIKRVLKFAIFKGGSSIRDFKNIEGKSGNFQQFFRVYGREGKECSRISCNGVIKKNIICGRSSFYCNKCQI